MKRCSRRGEYWLEACDSASMVMEKVTVATVTIDPATADSMAREPSVPAPNSRGHWISNSRGSQLSTSVIITANIADPMTITAGINQKLPRNCNQRRGSGTLTSL